jgi:predicted dehydrogenase
VVDDMADAPDCVEASWRFPGLVMHYTYRGFNAFRRFPHRRLSHGIAFYGTEGTMILDRSGFELYEARRTNEPVENEENPRHYGDGKPGNEVDSPWQRLFIDCVQGKAAVPVDLEQSHQATACCHLANVAYRVGRTIRWDAAKETIPDDAEAAALLDPPRRKGYELPAY